MFHEVGVKDAVTGTLVLFPLGVTFFYKSFVTVINIIFPDLEE